jgi:hypothetical protein
MQKNKIKKKLLRICACPFGNLLVGAVISAVDFQLASHVNCSRRRRQVHPAKDQMGI